MGAHPYADLPDRCYWSRGVARAFDPAAVADVPVPLLRAGDAVASIGSCFASHLVPYLEPAGFAYVRTEEPHYQLAHLPENLGYRSFSAAYGNVYTVRQMMQLLRRARGTWRPATDRWYCGDAVVDPFRPGLAYPAGSDVEFDVLTAYHLGCTAQAVAQADVLVLTLGLTEAWTAAEDGAVYPACPGTVAGTFDPALHVFRNFTVQEVADDLRALVAEARLLRPGLRVVVTVSPVPLVATATGGHVLAATTYSKSVLRVAAEEVARGTEEVYYFPAYEVVTGPQAPGTFFAPDRRSVTPEAVQAVVAALLAVCGGPGDAGRPGAPGRVEEDRARGVARASEAVARAECDEALLDPGPPDAVPPAG